MEGGRQVDSGGRLAYSALLIDDSDDLGHERLLSSDENAPEGAVQHLIISIGHRDFNCFSAFSLSFPTKNERLVFHVKHQGHLGAKTPWAQD